jgi:hypothetical protein
MEETTRINLVVGADIPDKLTALAGGERKRGDYLTGLIRAVYAGEREATAGADLEHMRLTLTGLAAKQMSTESRLLTVERELAAMIAERSVAAQRGG